MSMPAASGQSAIPWYNRLSSRLSVPILLSLIAVFITLPSAGYFFAQKAFLAGLEGQISLLAASINRYDGFYRSWMETNAMPVVRNFEAVGPDIADPKRLREVDFGGRSGGLLGQQGILARIRDSGGRYHIWHWRQQEMRWENADEDTSEDAIRDDMEDILELTADAPGWHTVPRRPGAEPDELHGEELTFDAGTGLLFSVPLRLAPPAKPAPGQAQEPSGQQAARDGEIYGVLTLSVSLAWFEERIGVLKNLKNSVVFLHTPTAGWTLPVALGRGSPAPAAKYNALSPKDKQTVAALRERMSRPEPGSMNLSLGGRNYVAVFMPLSMRSFMLGVLQPRDAVLGDLDVVTWLFVLTSGVLLLLAVYVLRRLTLSLLRPLVPLRRLAARLSQGDLSGPPLPRSPFHYEDEPARLWKSAERLRQALTQRVRDLTLLAVTRERLSGELTLARTLQQHLLPSALPRADNLRASAVLERAREVCGDTYDCFFLDRHRICAVLGGVDTRGIPAALSMGRAAPLLQELLLSGFSPADALGTVNRILSGQSGNKAARDASHPALSACVLDLRSGGLTWASAGQRPPYLLSAVGRPGADIPFFAGPALGENARARYEEQALRLEADSCLLFCTDRLPGIVNAEGLPFGKARLERLLEEAGPDPDALVGRIREAVLEHTAGRLGEDLVLLALCWTGERR